MDVTKIPQHLSDAATFDAFAVVEALECSTLGRTDLATFAAGSLDVVREYAVAREFITGDASGNPSLATATDLGAAADPIAALACLEQRIANDLFGRLGFVHVPPAVATYLKSGFAIESFDNGRTYRTASGNMVVISAGYDGRVPGGGDPNPGDNMYIYATGEVYAAFGMREMLDATERTQNTSHVIAEDAAVVAFDPCFALAIDTGLVFCDLSS